MEREMGFNVGGVVYSLKRRHPSSDDEKDVFNHFPRAKIVYFGMKGIVAGPPRDNDKIKVEFLSINKQYNVSPTEISHSPPTIFRRNDLVECQIDERCSETGAVNSWWEHAEVIDIYHKGDCSKCGYCEHRIIVGKKCDECPNGIAAWEDIFHNCLTYGEYEPCEDDDTYFYVVRLTDYKKRVPNSDDYKAHVFYDVIEIELRKGDARYPTWKPIITGPRTHFDEMQVLLDLDYDVEGEYMAEEKVESSEESSIPMNGLEAPIMAVQA